MTAPADAGCDRALETAIMTTLEYRDLEMVGRMLSVVPNASPLLMEKEGRI